MAAESRKKLYYQYWPDTIQVNIDDEWHIFEKFDLDIDSYHDYGWNPVMLSDYTFEGIKGFFT